MTYDANAVIPWEISFEGTPLYTSMDGINWEADMGESGAPTVASYGCTCSGCIVVGGSPGVDVEGQYAVVEDTSYPGFGGGTADCKWVSLDNPAHYIIFLEEPEEVTGAYWLLFIGASFLPVYFSGNPDGSGWQSQAGGDDPPPEITLADTCDSSTSSGESSAAALGWLYRPCGASSGMSSGPVTHEYTPCAPSSSAESGPASFEYIPC
jgi:hypothetical protein